MLTTQQIAQDLHLSRATVRNYFHQGTIPAIYVGGQWLVEETDYQTFKNSKKSAPAIDYGLIEPRSARALAARRGARTRELARKKKA